MVENGWTELAEKYERTRDALAGLVDWLEQDQADLILDHDLGPCSAGCGCALCDAREALMENHEANG
jgi:hypothetical protein